MNLKNTNIAFYTIVAIALSACVYFGIQSYNAQVEFSSLKQSYTSTLEWKDRILNVNNWLFVESEWTAKKVVTESLFQNFNDVQEQANFNGLLALLSALGGLFLCWLVGRKQDRLKQNMAISILVFSVAALSFGVACPMLEIEVYEENLTVDADFSGVRKPLKEAIDSRSDDLTDNTLVNIVPGLSGYLDGIKQDFSDWALAVLEDREITFEGRVYFFYQSKSIADLVSILWTQKNYFVAFAIAAFSIIIPVLKIVFSLMLLLSPKIGSKKRLKKIIGYIGKWSMADVFVAAIYLAYLSLGNMNAGVGTESNTLIGLYFFAGYVIFSICSFYLIDTYTKGLKQDDRIEIS